ncbi:MAG: DUF2085 domain-containing protein [Clostridiales bacterium]|nr:DUF2085 domain-containing protein [Clostridiales bacterium]
MRRFGSSEKYRAVIKCRREAFFVRGKQFPVCTRCTGAFAGYCVGGFAYVFLRFRYIL